MMKNISLAGSMGIILLVFIAGVNGGYKNGAFNFDFPDPHFGCDSSFVEKMQPFHDNVEHAINTVVSTAPESGTFHATHREEKGGVKVDVEANCTSKTTRCSECLRHVSEGLLHFCEARLVGEGRIPSNDGCSINYQAYANY